MYLYNLLFHKKNVLYTLVFFVSTNTHAYPTDASERLAQNHKKAGSPQRNFLIDIADSVDFIFSDPNLPRTYNTKTHKYDSGPNVNLQNAPLCANNKLPAAIRNAYNNSPANSKQRKAYWTIVSTCVAAAEGAEYWVDGKPTDTINKLDKNTSDNKFLYGAFQLSTESGSAVPNACIPSWNNSFKLIASKNGANASHIQAHRNLGQLSGLGNGKTSNASSLTSFGDMSKQRLNIYCGVHEVFRASTTNNGSCLPMYVQNGNRFNALRSGSRRLTDCINKHAPVAMRCSANIDSIAKGIAQGNCDSQPQRAGSDNSHR